MAAVGHRVGWSLSCLFAVTRCFVFFLKILNARARSQCTVSRSITQCKTGRWVGPCCFFSLSNVKRCQPLDIQRRPRSISSLLLPSWSPSSSSLSSSSSYECVVQLSSRGVVRCYWPEGKEATTARARARALPLTPRPGQASGARGRGRSRCRGTCPRPWRWCRRCAPGTS